jgi:hypothetical protein
VADREVPADVGAFLRDHVESYEQLEILLFLRARAHQTWASNALAAELGIAESLMEDALRFLCQRRLLGVVVSPGSVLFRYDPESAELAELVRRLADVCVEERLQIMRWMTANAIDRVRSRALSTFAEAGLSRCIKDEQD